MSDERHRPVAGAGPWGSHLTRLALAVAVLGFLSLVPGPRRAAVPAVVATSPPARSSPAEASRRLLVGVGDRVSLERGDRWQPLVAELDRLSLAVDMVQIWLPRGWNEDWVTRERLQELADRGITPVIVHYYFGDDISAQAVARERKGWRASLVRMAKLIRMDTPVLVVLEPEWNNEAPRGQTSLTDWPPFAGELRTAAGIVRRGAPNALVGTCPGDFEGTPDLERVLGPVAGDLDFIAFQEMRASTRARPDDPGYTRVADAAVDYARYLKRAFNRPLLLGYVAVSSYGGWEDVQASALRGLARRRRDLQEAGVFGLVYFQLFDDPAHRGYFGPAEPHFGLIRSDGSEKPSLEAFRALLR